MLQKVIKVAAFKSTNCGDAKKKNLIFVREHSDHATLKDNTLITEHYFTNT